VNSGKANNIHATGQYCAGGQSTGEPGEASDDRHPSNGG
jgi:hypothetical protein